MTDRQGLFACLSIVIWILSIRTTSLLERESLWRKSLGPDLHVKIKPVMVKLIPNL